MREVPTWQRIAIASIIALWMLGLAIGGYAFHQLDQKAGKDDVCRLEAKIDWLIAHHMERR